MNDKSSEVKKTVKNPLFTASVTGGTFEDFAQNAILFPAQEIPVSSTIITNTPNEDTASLQPTVSPVPENPTNFLPPDVILQENNPYYHDQQGKSQLSSVFSSFSNILTFGGSPNSNPPDPVSAPTQFEPLTGTKIENLEPIPLIPSSVSSVFPPQTHTNVVNPPLPSQGTSNNLYRRSGPRKPAYAQVPGLLSSRHIPPTGEFPAVPEQSAFPPLPNSSPSLQYPEVLVGQQKSQLQTPANYFQPIPNEQFTPPLVRSTPTGVITPTAPQSVSVSSSILQPEDPVTFSGIETSLSFDNSAPTQPFNSSVFSSSTAILNPVPSAPLPFFNPLTATPNFSSPVMAALPESEIPRTSSGMANPTSHLAFGNQNNLQSPINGTGMATNIYRPVYHHWFFKRVVEGRTLWQPFSMIDSLALENAFTSADISPTTVVPTDGGRYDVNILRRERFPVYWTAAPVEVRRCSWFHKGNAEGRFLPYEENIATMLEDEFRNAFETNEWHRKVELPNGETVVFHGPDVLVLFPPAQSTDAWGNTPQTQPRPRVVKRGMDEFDIDEGEPKTVDHILFIVHGIGAVCDLKFRTVEEVVDEFRSISLQLIRSHYRNSCDNKIVNRIEVLPISWHSRLHSEDTGIDNNLKNITLKSIPRLRDFTNDTLLDILFYTSPMYCQTIITTVGSELNRIYELFKHRNPTFCGGVSLGGHSLGSLILFDLLSHQHPPEKEENIVTEGDEDVLPPLKKPHPKDRRLSRRISYMMSEAGTGQPQLEYPHLDFQPTAFFALGSPIGMFVTVRGLDKLGHDFALPTCPAFFNIFHPYDPVAYRVESLINPQLANLKPVLIPHHKGRKRMHLELKETMARVSADLKQKLIDSMKNTWNTFFQVAIFGRQDNDSPPSLEAEVDKVFKERLAEEEANQECISTQSEDDATGLYLGILNKGRRIDHVLQEAPLESFNEYLFALTSHVCYWESEDTMLLILKEIYDTIGVTADNQIPQPTMTIERPCPSPQSFTNQASVSRPAGVRGMDPTIPINPLTNIGPPPTAGFVKKS